MSDIDIPPVPAIHGALVEWGSPLSLPGRSSRESAGDTLAEVARFLLDLADEGGELWRETECPHGEVFRHSLCQRAEHAPSDCLGWCDDGSCHRGWLPDDDTVEAAAEWVAGDQEIQDARARPPIGRGRRGLTCRTR